MNFVELNDVADITMGTSPKGNTLSNDPKDGIEFHQGKTNFTSMKLAPSKIYTTNSIKEAKPGSIVMSVRAPVGDCNITDREVSIGRGLCAIVGKENILTKFIYYYLVNNSGLIQSKATGSTFKAISTEDVKSIIIPLPPLPVQEEIVRILDAFTELESELESELAARKKQYEYYRDYLLTFGDKERERERAAWVALGEIGRVAMCKRIMKTQTSSEGDVPFYKIGTFGRSPNAFISNEIYEQYKRDYSFPRKGDVLISAAGTIGKTVIYDGEPAYYQDSNIVWLKHDESRVLNKYLYYCYQLSPWQVSTGGTIDRLYNDNITQARIPLPPLSEQQRIVSILDKFDALVNDISIGLPAEIEARRKQYEYYRDKLLTFKRKES